MPKSPSKTRGLTAILAAFVVAPWVFLAVCWIALRWAGAAGRPLREIPFFWMWAVLTIVLALTLAVVVGVGVMRLIRGAGVSVKSAR